MDTLNASMPLHIAQVMGKMVGGGLETVVMNYYRHIDRERVQFDFVIDSDSTYVPQDEIEKLGGRILYISPYQHIGRYMLDLDLLIKENNWSIMHSHMNTLSVFPLCIAKHAGIPYRIAHNHATAGKGEYAKNSVKYALRPLANLYPTHRLACSVHAGKWLFGRRSFEVVVNAFDVDGFAFDEEARSAYRKRHGVKSDAFVFGHAGRFAPPKNQDEIIQLFSIVLRKRPNDLLLLAGQGPDLPACQQLVCELGIQDSVRFLGQEDHMASFYSAIDAFLLPSTYEGLGLSLVEAQAAGLPCLASATISREANPTGNVRFLEHRATDAWVDAMCAIERRNSRKLSPDEAKALSRFDIQKAAPLLVEFYESLHKADSSGNQRRGRG